MKYVDSSKDTILEYQKIKWDIEAKEWHQEFYIKKRNTK